MVLYYGSLPLEIHFHLRMELLKIKGLTTLLNYIIEVC